MARLEQIKTSEIKSPTLTNNEPKKILEDIKNSLNRPLGKYLCMAKTEEDYQRQVKSYCQIIASNSLQKWTRLLAFFPTNSSEKVVLEDLKNHLEKIYQGELFQYNQKLALTSCDYLLEKC